MKKKTSTQNNTVNIACTRNTASVSQHVQKQKQPLLLFVCRKARDECEWVGRWEVLRARRNQSIREVKVVTCGIGSALRTTVGAFFFLI